jgi:two-component system cell cycle sensor histidine kinase/response regulator CckA
MTSHLRVLLVEDNAGDADLVQEYLSQASQAEFEVECVPRLTQAISLLRQGRIDVVLLDLGLPDSSGLETLTRVLEVAHGSPTIVLTGLDDDVTGLEAVRLGSQDYLFKGHLARDLLIRTILHSVERKRMQDELRESEKRYRDLWEKAPVMMISLDSEARITFVSDRFCDDLGYRRDEVLGRRPFEFQTPESAHYAQSFVFPAFLLTGSVKDAPLQLVKKNGDIIDVLLNVTAERDAQGAVVRSRSAYMDITEAKRTEGALKESEARYRYLVENIEDLISTHDLQGNLLFVSSGPAKLLGSSPADMVGKNLRSYLAPEVRDQFDAYLAAIQRDGRASGFMLVQSSRGEKRLWEYRNTLHRESGAAPIVLGVARDVTERRRGEQVERRLVAAIEQSAEGVIITNADGTIEYVNPGLERITGYSRDELIGQTPRILKSGEQGTEFYRRLWETIKAGNIWSGRFINRRKDGRLYHEDATITPVKDASGKIVNFVAVKRDITENLDLSKQLLQAQKMEAVGTLAGGVAHDFNNILQVALGYSELILADEGLPQHYRADLQKINESSRRGADLVQRLLTFSRKTEVKPLPLNLNRRVIEVRKMLERTIPKMIELQLHLAEDLATINADATQMDQILMNLAVNARDAMPEGGRLLIETSNVVLDEDYATSHLNAKTGQYVLLTFADSGSGMDKETLEHIFEPFYTTKGVGEGTGLGLAMVYGIVQQHGGHIECYSEPGEGTTFKIYFPAIVSNEEPGDKTARPMPRGGSETILLVDDENMIRDLCSRILTKSGYSVIAAPNGKEALEAYQQRGGEISLVILDLIMPEMSGKQCLDGLLSLDPAVKVVIASGYSADGTTKDALAAGAKGFVNKPYDIREVLEVVRSVLDDKVKS